MYKYKKNHLLWLVLWSRVTYTIEYIILTTNIISILYMYCTEKHKINYKILWLTNPIIYITYHVLKYLLFCSAAVWKHLLRSSFKLFKICDRRRPWAASVTLMASECFWCCYKFHSCKLHSALDRERKILRISWEYEALISLTHRFCVVASIETSRHWPSETNAWSGKEKAPGVNNLWTPHI